MCRRVPALCDNLLNYKYMQQSAGTLLHIGNFVPVRFQTQSNLTGIVMLRAVKSAGLRPKTGLKPSGNGTYTAARMLRPH